ncbi:MAG: thiamine-phosphate pyrophosphorylase [Campylobacterales bacterium]|nr:thiamine-phosphate pyrophosphorylase [Campylobacterales bacterium]
MTTNQELIRLCDANLNRLREAVRVLEDIARFVKDNKKLAKQLKSIRHKVRVENYQKYLQSRDIINDVLKENTKSEMERDDLNHIILANFKRSQESARTLEESFKVIDTKEASKFKQIRYELYNLEKEL